MLRARLVVFLSNEAPRFTRSRYRWEMDDREFSASGNDRRVAIQPDVGTLIFSDPILKDEGFYQCFATNRVGTAVTDVVYLRPASKSYIKLQFFFK